MRAGLAEATVRGGRALAVCVVAALVCGAGATAQQVADTAFAPAIGVPEYGPGSGPTVTIDAAHVNFHTAEGGYLTFAELLRRDGYVVGSNERAFTPEVLGGMEILVIANALHEQSRDAWAPLPNLSAFSEAEITAVEGWVREGGALLFIADHMPIAGHGEALAAAFGVRFHNGFALDSAGRGLATFRRSDGTLPAGRIANGRSPAERVDSVTTFTGQAFRIDPGVDYEPLLVFREGFSILLPDVAWEFSESTPRIPAAHLLQGAILRHGRGRVAVLGEAAAFTAQLSGPQATPMGMNAPVAGQNHEFALNLLHWLSGRSEDPGRANTQERLPILDMHLHALSADAQGPPPLGMCTGGEVIATWDPATPLPEAFLDAMRDPPCDDPVWSPTTDAELMRESLDVIERMNVIGVVSGTVDRVAEWRAEAPDRLIPGLMLNVGRQGAVTPDSIRALVAAGRLQVLGEVGNQYSGIAPDDPRMEPYWALAEELDLPVGIHVGTGPPGSPYLGFGAYRARMHSPLTMEEVLVRHPRLRVYLMHAGYPFLEDLLALLYVHPQVHVDVGVIAHTQPRAAFYRFLRGIVEAGFGERVMFGSDQMVWPGAIERGIAVIREAPFLTEQQKRAILYDNAARFLRLSEETIARHHRM